MFYKREDVYLLRMVQKGELYLLLHSYKMKYIFIHVYSIDGHHERMFLVGILHTFCTCFFVVMPLVK